MCAGAVVIRGQALQLVYRGLFSLRLRQHRDGIAPTPLLTEAIRVLYRACVELQMSQKRHFLASNTVAEAGCNGQDGAEPIGVSEAAVILSLSPRQVQRLAAQNGDLGGIRVGHAWALDRRAVLALAERRAR